MRRPSRLLCVAIIPFSRSSLNFVVRISDSIAIFEGAWALFRVEYVFLAIHGRSDMLFSFLCNHFISGLVMSYPRRMTQWNLKEVLLLTFILLIAYNYTIAGLLPPAMTWTQTSTVPAKDVKVSNRLKSLEVLINICKARPFSNRVALKVLERGFKKILFS
jgi:hypothetical protein